MQQQVDLVAVERDDVRLAEQAAVEPADAFHQARVETAMVHALPQGLERGGEGGGLVAQVFEQAGEGALAVDAGQQADVFREHGEQGAHEEVGDALRGVAGGFERFGEAGELVGDGAGDAGGLAAGVELERVEPEQPETLADGLIAQVVEPDAVVRRVGEGDVGGAGAGEFGVQLDRAAHVDHDDERWSALGGGQGAGVLVGLRMGAQHGAVPAVGIQIPTGLLGFEHEAATAVEVDEAAIGAPVGVADVHPALEHIGVVAGVVRGRIGARQAEQFAQFGEEELVVGAFGAAGGAPAGDEGVEVRVHERHAESVSVSPPSLQKMGSSLGQGSKE